MIPSERLSLYANYAFTRATFRDPAEIFSIRAEDAFVGSPLAGENDVTEGDRIPLVPDHQVKAGGLLSFPVGFQLGADLRYTGEQWLRGDEANETSPLGGYFVAICRPGSAAAGGGLGIVTNLFNADGPVFGTFNENRQTGAWSGSSPLNARSFKLVVRRSFGGET